MMKNTAALSPLAALVLSACGGAAQTAVPDTNRGLPVRTIAAERQDLDDTLRLNGTLKPRAQVQVVAEVSARLLKVVKDEGSRVAKGETLAVLDDTDYRLAHERARAALAVAEANRAHAQVEKERADNLQKTGGITDKDRLTAEVGLRVAEASFAQARVETEVTATQLARCQVTAPFSGRVAKRMADAGAMLASGAPVLILIDDAVLEFRASVPSADLGKAQVGALVEVAVDARGGRTVEGRVARIVPLVEERTRSFEIVVEVPGQKDLVGGLFARASVRVGRVEGALVVPPAALIRDGSRPGEADTFVVVGGKAERRTVSLGVEGPSAIQVTKGLEVGDQVVVDPPAALSSGAPVDVQGKR